MQFKGGFPMHRYDWRANFSTFRIMVAATMILAGLPVIAPARTESSANIEWFKKTEQALMDAVGLGDKKVWDQIMDPECIVTSEEGEVISKEEFLKELKPLRPGLSGSIVVRDLTVQEFPSFAVVRFLVDEHETVFGQKLATKYRTTDTFRRAGASWKLVASHISVVTADPPMQDVSAEGWAGLAGVYKLLPDGWTFHVELREGKLFGGRDAAKLKPLIPLTPDAFVLQGNLGEWMFVVGKDGKATQILWFRKFEPIVWTRVQDQ
jgi:hypothetical protein